MSYRLPRLGSLDAIHLASADPFWPDLAELVTYDVGLAKAASDLGFPASAPSRRVGQTYEADLTGTCSGTSTGSAE